MKWPHLGLPLLAKELVEQSARRRTYAVRTAYASLLFAAGFLVYYEVVSAGVNSPIAVLGHGRRMFQLLVYLQFAGIYLFLPAMTCGVLTVEKERNSLGLLFLTRLGPWTILFEKLLGRMIPMFSFLLLSVPLLVIAYSLGGLTQSYLWSGIWFLSVTAFHVGALALMCSAYFRTTVASFIASYLCGAFVVYVLPICQALHLLDVRGMASWLERYLGFSMLRGPLPAENMFDAPGLFGAAAGLGPGAVFFASVPMILAAICFLLLARAFILRRAFVPPRNLLLRLFRQLDAFFTRINRNRITRGIVLVRESTSLPRHEPVAWRETTKRSLGTFRYLVRVLVVFEFLVLSVCALAAAVSSVQYGPLTVLLFMLWLLAVLVVSVTSASLVARERSHETLDVLLTTPLSGQEIIRQKVCGIRRLMGVLAIPFLTAILFKTWWMATVRDQKVALYLVCNLLALAIYLPLVAWLSILIGIRVRTQTRAIFTALAVIAGWSIVPVILSAMILNMVESNINSPLAYIVLFSPVSIIPLNEFFMLRQFDLAPWFAVIINFLLYGACVVLFRYVCLRSADHYLGGRSRHQDLVLRGELPGGKSQAQVPT